MSTFIERRSDFSAARRSYGPLLFRPVSLTLQSILLRGTSVIVITEMKIFHVFP